MFRVNDLDSQLCPIILSRGIIFSRIDGTSVLGRSSFDSHTSEPVYFDESIKLVSPIIQGAASKMLANLQGSLFGGPKNYGYLQVAKSIDAQEAGGQVITTNTFTNARRSRSL